MPIRRGEEGREEEGREEEGREKEEKEGPCASRQRLIPSVRR